MWWGRRRSAAGAHNRLLQGTTSFKGCVVWARDGDAGHVRDVVLDRHLTRVEYFEVDTGGWLTGRRVMVAMAKAGEVEVECECHLSFDLTRLQIDLSSDLSSAECSQLGRASRIVGCHVHALDGPVGQVRNVLIDIRTWRVAFLVVGKPWWWWWSADDVLITPASVQYFDARRGAVEVALTRHEMRESSCLG